MIRILLLLYFFCSSHSLIEWMDKEIKENVWIKMFISYPENKYAPLVLFLNGGLGTPMISYVPLITPFFDKYIFVAPEQRGVFSINQTNPSSSLKEHIEDLGLVLEYATKRFRKPKAIVWGLSFGGTFALLMADQFHLNIASIIATGPILGNIEKIKNNESIINRINQTSMENCQYVLSNLPWFLFFLKWIGCPGPDSNYWFSIFYFTQFYSKLGLMTSCETRTPFCNPDYTPDIFDIISSPFIGFWETARLGLSNVNYVITNNIPMRSIVWDFKPLKVPFYLIASRKDRAIFDFILEDAFNDIDAPEKDVYWFQNAGHMSFLEEKEEHYKFLDYFIEQTKSFESKNLV
jgi:pimeloyl-ACP methyl ester carboxylesterase